MLSLQQEYNPDPFPPNKNLKTTTTHRYKPILQPTKFACLLASTGLGVTVVINSHQFKN